MSQPPTVVDHKQLTAIYKKNGSFDNQRKLLLENFKQSQTHTNLLLKLKLMVESKIKHDPQILMKNKGKMGALIQGEIINHHVNSSEKDAASLLSIVDKDIQDKIIDSPEFHAILRDELKDINRKMLGISDEDYAKQLAEEKEQQRLQQEELERQRLEKEQAYKNSFKVKRLNSPPHKVTKAPRFNFGNSNNRHLRDDAGGSRGLGPKKPFMMY